MAASWKWPSVLNQILHDVPIINLLLNALLKQDPEGTEDVPAGAKRWTDTAVGKQFQVFNGDSWGSVGKLDHDAASVDGFDAAPGVVKNTIPVRDANGDLPGNLLGNAKTATKAEGLSKVLDVALGGTGAATAAGARAKLGVPPADHASDTITYGIGNSGKWGHLKSSDKADSTKTASGGWAASPAALALVQEALNESVSTVQTTANKGVSDAAAAKAAAAAAQNTADTGVSAAAAAKTAADKAQDTANAALPQSGGNISGSLTVKNLPVATFNSSGQLVFPNGTKFWVA